MGVFVDNVSYFSLKPYVMTPYLNRLTKTVQRRGHNIRFEAELTKKIIPNYHQYSLISIALVLTLHLILLTWLEQFL